MKKITILLTILAAGVFTRCEDFLDRQPVSVAVDEKFWNTETEAESGVAGGYSLLREALCNISAYWTYGDIPTDELMFPEDRWYYDFIDVYKYGLNLSVPEAEIWRPMRHFRDWTYFYRAVDQSNRVIARISGMADNKFTTTDKNHLLGEGYFLRAFTYFYMTRVWGDVPLILEPYNDPLTAEFVVPRDPEENVHVQIESDLAKALELLTTERRGRPGSRASLAVAYALKAHFAAWKGEYGEVITALDGFEGIVGTSVSNYGPRDEANYLDRYYLGNTSDNIFYIPRLLDDNESSSRWGGAVDGDIAANLGVWIGDDTRYHIDPKTQPFLLLNESRLADLYEPTDARLMYGFKYYNEEGFRPVTLKYLNFSVGHEPFRARYSYVVNIFRYTELRLLKAEALAVTGSDPEAKEILNEVRDVNGLDPWDESGDLYEEIMDERARELYMEGHRFYDMVRMAKRGVFRFSNMNPDDFNNGKYYWPVDPVLFINNPGLTQTDFWSSLL